MPARTARRIGPASPGARERDDEPVGRRATAASISARMRGTLKSRGSGSDRGVHLAGGGVDAVAHRRPERARGLAVRHDRDPDGAPRRRASAAAGSAAAAAAALDHEVGLAHLLRAAAAASRERQAAAPARPGSSRRLGPTAGGRPALARGAGAVGMRAPRRVPPPRRAVDRERARRARRRGPAARAGRCPRRLGAADAVVADLDDELAPSRRTARARGRLRRTCDVRQRLGDDEVRRRLDRRRRGAPRRPRCATSVDRTAAALASAPTPGPGRGRSARPGGCRARARAARRGRRRASRSSSTTRLGAAS